MSPTILFVPGFWVGPKPYEEVAKIISDAGFKTEVTRIASTGTLSPGNETLLDDVASVHKDVEKILDRGEDVVVVLHSAGGFIGGGAIQGLTKSERDGRSCVRAAVLVTASIWPAGERRKALPTFYIKDGGSYCKDPETFLYSDLPKASRTKWLDDLNPQPAQDWDTLMPPAPWADLPSTYIVCENDKLIPAARQEEFARLAGSKIERLEAGHMPMVVAPQLTAEVIMASIRSMIK